MLGALPTPGTPTGGEDVNRHSGNSGEVLASTAGVAALHSLPQPSTISTIGDQGAMMKMRRVLRFVSVILLVTMSCGSGDGDQGNDIAGDIGALGDGVSDGDLVSSLDASDLEESEGTSLQPDGDGEGVPEPDVCVPNCMVDGEDDEEYLSECGTDDGCGGECNVCEPDDVCALADYAEVGLCFNPEEECPEVCMFELAECGSVWAGFVWPDCECGDCPEKQDECVDGKCTCKPDCWGKACGPDGCGGSCGTCLLGCPSPSFCDAGICVAACAPNCAGKSCGNDGCGCECGECGAGFACTVGGTCKASVCGNGVVDFNEECDDGNTDSGDGCSAECNWESVCGDGVIEPPEQCDDGNTDDGDGCSAECKNE